MLRRLSDRLCSASSQLLTDLPETLPKSLIVRASRRLFLLTILKALASHPSPFSRLRPTSTTVAPLLASSLAVTLPMPEVLPVTRQIFPCILLSDIFNIPFSEKLSLTGATVQENVLFSVMSCFARPVVISPISLALASSPLWTAFQNATFCSR